MKRLTFDKDGRLKSVDGNSMAIWDDSKLPIEAEEVKSRLLMSRDLDFLREETLPGTPDSEYWSLHEEGRDLKPLIYSNGKSEADIVREVVELIRSGKKVIFIHGVCGTGKSSIALNISRILGKSSIVVPIKSLQSQYEEDYTKKKYVLRPNGKKMRIALITGRDNHDSVVNPGVSCADPLLPDNIIITEKNKYKLFEYYKENPFIQNKTIHDVKYLKRISVAPANPYWSPILPDKYELEMSLGRKPETEVDIIDEADNFLDNFSKEFTLDISHLQNSLQHIMPENELAEIAIRKLRELLENELRQKGAIGVDEGRIFPLSET